MRISKHKKDIELSSASLIELKYEKRMCEWQLQYIDNENLPQTNSFRRWYERRIDECIFWINKREAEIKFKGLKKWLTIDCSI